MLAWIIYHWCKYIFFCWTFSLYLFDSNNCCDSSHISAISTWKTGWISQESFLTRSCRNLFFWERFQNRDSIFILKAYCWLSPSLSWIYYLTMQRKASCCRKERLITTFTFFKIFQIIISPWNTKHLDVVKEVCLSHSLSLRYSKL